MDLRNLMSGIAVVIDDALEGVGADDEGKAEIGDRIDEIVEQIEKSWNLPFYKTRKMPPEATWPNLLQAACFILLDWRLWPLGALDLEKEGVKTNIQFLEQARDFFVPVFIFTNENLEDVKNELPPKVYRKDALEKNFVFIRRKSDLFSGDGSLDCSSIEEWIKQNASVYALKTWEKEFFVAKKELFSSMYAKSPNWPSVFWNSYKDDKVDPSSSLMHLINENLHGRMQTNSFKAENFPDNSADVPRGELLALIGATCFRTKEKLPEDEIRCGDLFKQSKGKFLLNLRPDCDCVPRDGQVGNVELYCVEGRKMRDSELCKQYQRETGRFSERVWESVAFSIYEGKSLRFDFRKLSVRKFSELENCRVGRLLHPYITGIQQRYALYQQRQGLPRVPCSAVPQRDHSCLP